jgi:hypothetical protein
MGERGIAMGRTVDACKSCGKQKEIVSGGLCNACRMAADRAPGELPGRYVTAKKKSDAKIRKYLNGLIDNLLGLQEEGYLSPDSKALVLMFALLICAVPFRGQTVVYSNTSIYVDEFSAAPFMAAHRQAPKCDGISLVTRDSKTKLYPRYLIKWWRTKNSKDIIILKDRGRYSLYVGDDYLQAMNNACEAIANPKAAWVDWYSMQ